MLHTFLHPPFADPIRQAQFEALQATLAAEPEAPAVSLLLGNFAVQHGGEVFDAVLVRPHSVSILVLITGGGQLDIPTPNTSSWQLAGQPLLINNSAANPFGRFRRLKEELAEWLAAQLGPGQVAPELITGLTLFTEPVTFGPGVEQYLRTQPGADSFQLLGDLRQLPRRLRQLAHPDIQLSDAELHNWAQDLAAEHPEAEELLTDEELDSETAAPGFWEQKARQLWHWLGAEDVPHDAPYGTATVAATTEEKQHLEQMRQQIRTELAQQRQAMEAREAEREKSIALLRAQLAQAPAAAADAAALQARLVTETQEKAALEEAIRAARADAAVRNQELDARIQQLGQLIEQFQSKPAGPAPVGNTPVAKRQTAASHSPNLVRRPTTQLNWPRVAIVVAAALGVGLGAWGLVRLQDNTPKEPTHYSAQNQQPDNSSADEAATSAPEGEDQEPAVELDTVAAESQLETATDTPAQPEHVTPPEDASHDTVYIAPEGPVETDSAAAPNE